MQKSSKATRIDKDEYVQFLFAKHHVVPGYQAETFDQVIDSVVGVHSARLPTPYVAFYSRMRYLTPTDYRNATFRGNQLIKLRCMRKTLHTVTQALAPIVHVATLDLRTKPILSELMRHGCSLKKANALTSGIVGIALASPLSHSEVLGWLASQVTNADSTLSPQTVSKLSRLLLKWSWENGELCYLNRSDHWSNEERFYGSTRLLYPKLTLNNITKEEAIHELVTRHIYSFGPVSETDIAWWSGIRLSQVRLALESLAPKLIRVNLDGVGDDLLMATETFEEFRRFRRRPPTDPWCAFLAYEDPTLKGYFDTRGRYVEKVNYFKLFNQIGEARPCICFNGQVIGIWSWNSKTKQICTQIFRTLSKSEQSLVLKKKRHLEGYLDEVAERTPPLSGLED